MTTRVVSSVDGPRITVNDYLKDPLRIPTLVIDMMKQGFLADALLRNGGTNESGAVRFNESTPPYADDAADIVEEFAEVPVAATSVGDPRVVFVDERALAIVVSDRMRRRQNTDAVTRQLTQVKNTLIMGWDDAFISALLANPGIFSVTAGDTTPTAWGVSSADIRADINAAREKIETATTGGTGNPLFGFEADTLVVNKASKFDLLNSSQFATPYVGDIASENLHYTGKLPKKILDLDVVTSPRVPVGKAIVMQRKIAGFISDEVPLQATPLYRDEPRKTWRSDVQRASAIGIDQPKAVCVINGV